MDGSAVRHETSIAKTLERVEHAKREAPAGAGVPHVTPRAEHLTINVPARPGVVTITRVVRGSHPASPPAKR
jgi:hypothetical protein